MKRLLALLLCALLILALCACGETEPKITVQTEAPKATATPKPAATTKPTATPKPTKAPKETAEPTEEPALVALEPTDPEQTGETDRAAPAADPESEGRDYVLNINTMKFHYPTCSSVKDIKEGNRKDVHATRDSIIAQGYAPCGKCKP